MEALPRLLPRLFAVLSLALAAGCGATPEIIDPIIEIPSDRWLVVVPFKDENFRNGLDSPRGVELAGRVTKLLESKASFKVRPLEDVMRLYDEENPRDLTNDEICRKTGADYILTGDVTVWRTRDPGSINILRGTSQVVVQIFESAKTKLEREKEDNPKERNGSVSKKHGRVVRTAEVAGVFPKEYGLEDVGVVDVGHTPQFIETGLKNTTSIKIAELLYGHTKEESRLAQD